MTEHYSITPPPELVQQWQEAWYRSKVKPAEYALYIANCAAQWGADTELEACCEWLKSEGHEYEHEALFAARRPKPPSLKEQSLALINRIQSTREAWLVEELDVVRKALEALPDD